MNKGRTLCIIYSRVVGWLTPTKNWNLGKQSEYEDRKEYKQ
jgi:anaerobic ribonucleoside-triphosphate reductase